MADISKLSRLISGVQRNVDLSTNTIVVGSIKIGVGATELTQTILDKLITMQSIARADGKYDAEDIVVAHVGSNYSAATPDVEAHLAAIDTALTTAGGTEFSDTTFRIFDSGDNLGIKFNVDAITSIDKTITVPDANIDLGDIATNTAKIDDLITLSGVPANSEDLGTFTGTLVPDNSTIKEAIQALESEIEAIPSPFYYAGVWAASTNTPTLDNTDVGVGGAVYYVTDSGTVDFGAGSMVFNAGDKVANNGTTWDKWDMTENVASVNGQTGAVVLTTTNISEGSNLYFTDARARTAAVADAIADSVTDIAPSQNAVYDALILKQDASAELDEAETFFAATNITGAEAEQLSDGSNADSLHSHGAIKRTMIAGEAFAASLFAVRPAKAADSGFVAGRVYKADIDASSVDNFHVSGLVNSAASAAGNIVVTKVGPMTVTAHGFTVGQPLYLSTTGTITETPPSTANMAVVKVGMAEDANTIDVQIQIMGVN